MPRHRYHLSIKPFGGDSAATLVSSNLPVADIEYSSLKANGRTPMGDALRSAQELIEDREAFPSRSFLPTLALVSDGIPTDPSWEPELELLINSERGQKAAFRWRSGRTPTASSARAVQRWEVHEASEAGEIRKFLRFVTTTTITQATLSVFDPDVSAELDSEESIGRLLR